MSSIENVSGSYSADVEKITTTVEEISISNLNFINTLTPAVEKQRSLRSNVMEVVVTKNKKEELESKFTFTPAGFRKFELDTHGFAVAIQNGNVYLAQLPDTNEKVLILAKPAGVRKSHSFRDKLISNTLNLTEGKWNFDLQVVNKEEKIFKLVNKGLITETTEAEIAAEVTDEMSMFS